MSLGLFPTPPPQCGLARIAYRDDGYASTASDTMPCCERRSSHRRMLHPTALTVSCALQGRIPGPLCGLLWCRRMRQRRAGEQ